MIWVLRPGKEGVYYDQFITGQKLFLPWTDYNTDLSRIKERKEFRDIVIKEKHPDAQTTVSNWSGQLYSFCFEMKEKDLVLIPKRHSVEYAVVRLIGGYKYENNGNFHHFREYELVAQGIPRTAFTQTTQYTLGAYRTLFKVKQTEEVLRVIKLYLNDEHKE